MRYLPAFTTSESNLLISYLQNPDLLERERIRFSAVLFSSRFRNSIKELSVLFGVSENTIKSWFNQYETSGFKGLLDKNLAHKKNPLSCVPDALMMEAVSKTPQDLGQVVNTLQDTLKITTTKRRLHNYLKKKNILGNECVSP